VQILNHLLGVSFAALVFVGPLPLSLVVAINSHTASKDRELQHCALVTIVSWCVVSCSTALFLGTIHQLNSAGVIVAEAILFAIGVLLLVFIPNSFSAIKEIVSGHKEKPFLHGMLIKCLVIMALLLSYQLLFNIITNFDSYNYHLPNMATWYQTGSLDRLGLSPTQSYYAFNWDALCTLLIFPFQGDYLVSAPNLPAWSLVGLSIYLISLTLGAGKSIGLASASLVLAVPLMLEKVKSMQNDIPFTAFLLAAAYFALLFVRERRGSYLALFSASLGMALGIKASGIAYAALLIVLFLSLLVYESFRKRGEDKRGKDIKNHYPAYLAAGLAVFVFLGGYWYAKNYAETGNPFGEIEIKAGGWVLFQGDIKSEDVYRTTLAYNFNPASLSDWRLALDQAWENLGFPFFALAIMAMAFPIAVIRNIGKGSWTTFALPVLLAAILLIIYFYTPYSAVTHLQVKPGQVHAQFGERNFRYAFPFIGVLGIAGAVVTTKLRMRKELILVCAVVGCLLFFTISLHVFLAGTVLLLLWVLAESLGMVSCLSRLLRIRGVRLTSVFLAVAATALVTWSAKEERAFRFNRWYWGIPEYVETQTEKGEPVGYVTSRKFYGLYGRDLQKEVIRVPVESANVEEWVNSIREKGINVVGFGPLGGVLNGGGIERSWLDDPKGCLERVAGENPFERMLLYRLKQ